MLPKKLNERNLLCEVKINKANVHCVLIDIISGLFRNFTISTRTWEALFLERAVSFFEEDKPLFETNEQEQIKDVTEIHYSDGSTRFAFECQFEISEDETTDKKLWTEKLNSLKERLQAFVTSGLEDKEIITSATTIAENKINFIEDDSWKIITRDGKLFTQTTIYFE